MVESPVFFAQPLWVREPRGWKPNIVRGRYEDLTAGEGLRIFTECLERAEGLGAAQPAGALAAAEGGARFGAPAEIRPRLGQGTFRISVLDAYHRACAVTGEHSLPVLEAAHIRPYSDGGLHEVPNGIALRSDIHRLFDLGYVTVTPEYRFRISDSLAADFHNGRTYYALQDTDLLLPSSASEYPNRDLLDWHGQVIYRS